MRPETTVKREEIVIRLVIELTAAGPRVNVAPMTPALALVGGTEALETPQVTGHDPHRLILEWQRDARLRLGWSEEHVSRSARVAREFFATRTLDRFSPPEVMGWLTGMIDHEKPGTRTTARNKCSVLRSFGEYLLLRQIVTVDPCAGVSVAGNRGRRGHNWQPFNAEDVVALVTRAEKREAACWQTRRRGPLASTFYRFLALTTLRYGEARVQAAADVDLLNATITVTLDKARRNDKLPLCAEAVELIRTWLAHDAVIAARSPRLFPWAPSHHTLREDMKACGIADSAAGVKGEWHRFRKYGIRELARAGANWRELHKFARHTDVNETMGVYDLSTVDELRSTAGLMRKIRKSGGNGVAGRADRRYVMDAQTEGPTGESSSPRRKQTNDPCRRSGSRSEQLGTSSVPRKGRSLGLGETESLNGAAGNRTQGSVQGLIDQITNAHVLYLDVVLRLVEESDGDTSQDSRQGQP